MERKKFGFLSKHLRKTRSFFNFRKVSGNVLAFCQVNFVGAVKSAFYVSRRTILKRWFLIEEFLLLLHSDFDLKIFSLLPTNFLLGFQSYILCFHMNISKKNLSCDKLQALILLSDIERRFFGFLTKKKQKKTQAVKTAFYVSMQPV